MTVRVLDELVRPMNELRIDETEFVCLRAIVFFNPSKWLEPFREKAFTLGNR